MLLNREEPAKRGVVFYNNYFWGSQKLCLQFVGVFNKVSTFCTFQKSNNFYGQNSLRIPIRIWHIS